MYCKEYDCILTKKACITRWKKANQKPKTGKSLFPDTKIMQIRIGLCKNCTVGKNLAKRQDFDDSECKKLNRIVKETKSVYRNNNG